MLHVFAANAHAATGRFLTRAVGERKPFLEWFYGLLEKQSTRLNRLPPLLYQQRMVHTAGIKSKNAAVNLVWLHMRHIGVTIENVVLTIEKLPVMDLNHDSKIQNLVSCQLDEQGIKAPLDGFEPP